MYVITMIRNSVRFQTSDSKLDFSKMNKRVMPVIIVEPKLAKFIDNAWSTSDDDPKPGIPEWVIKLLLVLFFFTILIVTTVLLNMYIFSLIK